ncbi:DUF3667 domain-containing protein [Planktosalinus lacus]|uniref:DUF3667 domain-containing protein n=1 Tax=Planktosalinus lacus TaxID=1526573 RepID=A0A8J2V9H9_9FLAO|nr:DUF3667 domain-containing protein [Planktosalinus lacus]GGD87712.1 hypothetical protein GCM10011312_09660 [Planktosalinus lacus]
MLDKLSVWFASSLPSNETGRKSLKYRGEKCLNCDHPLDKSDKYCPNCSQLNSTKKLHFNDLFNEFFGSIFAYDSRIIRTLKVLLFKPGIISKEYVEGKRMRYANPFRFYLSVSIIFFLLSGLLNKISELTQDTNNKPTAITSSNIKTNNDKDATLELKSALKELSNPAIDSLKIEEKLNEPKTESKLRYFSEQELATMSFRKSYTSRIEVYSDFYTENKDLKPSDALAELNHQNSAKNRWLYKKVMDFDFFINNTDFAYNYFISKLPIVIFLFMPIFALFIKLLYIRRKQYTYMEHLVFAFHVQSLFFVLLIITLFFDYFLNTSLFTSLALFAFLIYLYKAMRNFYLQSRFKTFVKFVILNTLFSILATFAAMGYALLSFSMY